MKVLNPAQFTPMTIDGEGTELFEAFLDRNYPDWREREIFRPKYGGTIQRCWLAIGNDDVERVAFYRDGFVEVCDRCIGLDDDEEGEIHWLKSMICDIDGDRTPVAVWGQRVEPAE